MIKSNSKEAPLVLGILGAGQLAKMLANEAYKMGINVATIEKGKATPAGDMTQMEFTLGWENEKDLSNFIDQCDIVTLENEFISPSIIEKIEKRVPVFPSSATMNKIQDKFIQKTNFQNAGLPVPVFSEINNAKDAEDFGAKNGYPYIIKTRTLGYDGYGNFLVESKDDIAKAFEKFGERKLMAEKFVKFQKELAVMAVRGANGETAVYPCVETIQKNHICHIVIAPAAIDEAIQAKAQEIAQKCVAAIDGIGIFGVEMFIDDKNELLINEIAPRPHNSGHYTIEGCYTSQFENCIRAVLGLPLGSAELVLPAAVMVNLLGERDGIGTPTNVNNMLKYDKAKLHLYNKKSSRVGRKMGHITSIGNDRDAVLKYTLDAANSLEW